MQLRRAIPLAFASAVVAQNLTQVLNTQNDTLSVLNGLLASHPNVTNLLGNATNITFLAPNNDAMNALLADNSTSTLLSDEGYLKALLFYHTLNGTYRTGDFNDTDRFIPTYLTNETYTSLDGGQRLQARRDNNNVTFTSYEKLNASVVSSNINFNSGAIQIINRVLKIPQNTTDGLVDANLTAAAGAIRNADLETAIAGFKNVTIFAPDNDAFSAISNLVNGLSASDLAAIVGYHVVNNSVIYSSMLQNKTMLRAMDGTELKVTVENDEMFVNSAKITVPDLLVSDGVIHVVNQVLNPANATEAPNASATQAPAPAFSGATSAADGQVPFTSDIPSPTTTFPAATSASSGNEGGDGNGNGNNGGSGGNGGEGSESSTSNPGMPMKTGAVGAAALFGGAAVFLNF